MSSDSHATKPTMFNHPDQVDDRFIARAKKFSSAASVFVMPVGVIVLTG